MFNLLHSISDQELFENPLCNPCIPKQRNGAMHPSYINFHLKSEVSITLCCWLCSTCYTAVRIKNCLKSTSAIKNSHYEKYERFTLQWETIMCYHQIDTFTVSKDEWDTKEDTGKSMKNALYVLRYAKRHPLG